MSTEDASTLHNEAMKTHQFLKQMCNEEYYPQVAVNQGKDILIRLCQAIETQQPTTLEELYTLTHAATIEFNELEQVFEELGSEIETIARECIGEDFYIIARAYGFAHADIEELIAPRDW